MDNEDKESKEENEKYLYFRKKLDSIKEENERILGRNTLVVVGGAFTLSVTLFSGFFMDRFLLSQLFKIKRGKNGNGEKRRTCCKKP